MTTAVGSPRPRPTTKRPPSQRLYFLCSGGMWDGTVEYWLERPLSRCVGAYPLAVEDFHDVPGQPDLHFVADVFERDAVEHLFDRDMVRLVRWAALFHEESS